jgi:hypothetical protein
MTLHDIVPTNPMIKIEKKLLKTSIASSFFIK